MIVSIKPNLRAPGVSKKLMCPINGEGVGVDVMVGVKDANGGSVMVIVEVGFGVFVTGGGVTVGVKVSATGVPP